MGATSVTGVGTGSAAKYGAGNKGSEHMALGVHRLIGPRVVACGEVELGPSGFATVYYPTLPGGAGLYCAFLQGETPGYPFVTNFTASSFVVNGDQEEDEVCWQIVKKGLWGSLENDGPASAISPT
jgi:hypothetical protein